MAELCTNAQLPEPVCLASCRQEQPCLLLSSLIAVFFLVTCFPTSSFGIPFTQSTHGAAGCVTSFTQ